ncbi:hypothetical protein [Bacillus solitudinis]|uniref:hypothetical protein n=1 Tax=Bacillus solitudinis TaxID=2014074 RepID=UPI0012FE08B3|nr:hypothetical protein [Bacillus solitudinis]
MKFLLKLKEVVEQTNEVIDSAKAIKQGNGTKNIGAKILKKKASKRIPKLFK